MTCAKDNCLRDAAFLMPFLRSESPVAGEGPKPGTNRLAPWWSLLCLQGKLPNQAPKGAILYLCGE